MEPRISSALRWKPFPSFNLAVTLTVFLCFFVFSIGKLLLNSNPQEFTKNHSNFKGFNNDKDNKNNSNTINASEHFLGQVFWRYPLLILVTFYVAGPTISLLQLKKLRLQEIKYVFLICYVLNAYFTEPPWIFFSHHSVVILPEYSVTIGTSVNQKAVLITKVWKT